MTRMEVIQIETNPVIKHLVKKVNSSMSSDVCTKSKNHKIRLRNYV